MNEIMILMIEIKRRRVSLCLWEWKSGSAWVRRERANNAPKFKENSVF